jgi:hypothetical protein
VTGGEPAVVHLVWAPLGPEPLVRFVASLRRHRSGCDHRLAVVFNGFDGRPAPAYTAALEGVEHEAVILPEPVQDLVAYRMAADRVDAGAMCFVNSYGEVLVDGWLARLDAARREPGAGIVGASGSWESAASSAPLALRLQRHLRFPRFPNPHMRTSAFMLDRGLLLDLDWSGAQTKLGALRLESGRRSLSRQVLARGLGLWVVDRDGRRWEPEQWPASRTFRSGEQEGLLVGDNRTEQYRVAGAAERAELARMAWGAQAPRGPDQGR